MYRLLTLVVVVSLVSACGKSSSPTTPTSTAGTRIIGLNGSLGFGVIQVGQSDTRTLTIFNQGTGTLTVSGLSGQSGNVFTTSWTGGTIPAGGSQPVVIRCTPVGAQTYSGTVTVNADHTSGVNTAPISCAGTLDGIAVFSQSGKGNTVFDIPTYIQRVRIQGSWDRTSNSNFIVNIAGRLIVNEILRESINYDGTHLLPNGGGTVSITNSNQISWTITELR